MNHVKKVVDETGLQHFADFERVEESGGSFMREMSHSLFGLLFSDTSEQKDGNNNLENNFNCHEIQQAILSLIVCLTQ